MLDGLIRGTGMLQKSIGAYTMKLKTQRCLASLLCLTVLVGLVPLAGLLNTNAITDTGVAHFTFTKEYQTYYLSAPTYSNHTTSTQYTLSFDYYYAPAASGGVSGYAKDSYLTIYNAGGGSDYLWHPAKDADGIDISGDASSLTQVGTVYKGFKMNQSAHMTLNVTLDANQTFKPTLYTYGPCDLYIWNYTLRINRKVVSGTNPTGSSADILIDRTKKLSDFDWNDYNEWVDDQAVIECTFDDAAGQFVVMSAHFNVFTNGNRDTWKALCYNADGTVKRLQFEIEFDYYLDSSKDITTTPSGGNALDYVGGCQDWTGTTDTSEWRLFAKKEGTFHQKMEAWAPSGSDTVAVVRPTFKAGVEGAKLYIWNFTIKCVSNGVTYTSLELGDEADYCDTSHSSGVTVKKGLSRSNYKWAANYKDHDVIEAKLKTTTNKSAAQDAEHPYSWWMMSADLTKFDFSQMAYNTMVALADDSMKTTMTLTFDYYVSAPDGTDVTLCNDAAASGDTVGSPGGYQDYVRGNKKLFLGEKRNFTMALQAYHHYECRPYIRSSAPAKVYVWNVRVECAGRVYDTWGNGGTDAAAANNWVSSDESAADYGTTQVKNITTLDEYVVYNKLIEDLEQPTIADDTKVFVGWLDEENEPYYRKDMVSEWHQRREQWYNFYTGGTQIRSTAGSKGLRFRFFIDERFNDNEYITDLNKQVVYLPEIARGNAELVLKDAEGKSVVYTAANGKSTQAVARDCPKYYDPNKNMYTAVILNNATNSNVANVYAARGYLTFTSLNGIPYEKYTSDSNTFTTNYDDADDKAKGTMARSYNAVLEILANGGSTSGDTLANPTTPTTTVTTSRVTVATTKLSTEAGEATAWKATVVGTNEDFNTHVYTVANGVAVREARIQSGRGDGEVTLVQISDSHLSEALNSVDLASPYKALIEKSYNHSYPTWETEGKGQASANLAKCMDYAKYFDQTVHTGDLISYLSDANIKKAIDLVWKVDPDTMLVAGNHDTARDYQASDKTSSFDSRVLALENGLRTASTAMASWDAAYSSKVIKDKVMAITFNNNIKPTNATVIKMTRDIQKAREMGYVVLVFAHEPFITDNPADTEVYELEKYPRGSEEYKVYANRSEEQHADDIKNYVMNFYKPTVYKTDYFGGPDSTGNERAVWDLITTNGDVVRGVFGGHWHVTNYSEILATDINRKPVKIPQYLLRSSGSTNGHVTRIRVY